MLLPFGNGGHGEFGQGRRAVFRGESIERSKGKMIAVKRLWRMAREERIGQ